MQGNILILSAGRRVSLVRAFMKAAASVDKNIKIFTGDANPVLSSACQVSDESVQLPRIDNENFISFLKGYALNKNITVIIPTIDTELLILSSHKKEFEESGVYIMVPDNDFVSICRNKRLTHQFFKEKGISVAEEISKDNIRFPLFVKPEDGSSSNHIYYAPEKKYLPPFVLDEPRFMLLEYLDRKLYDEFTTDMYFNRNGKLCCAVPRLRIETRGGEVSKGVTSKNFLVKWLHEKFASLPGARGCVTMQFFVHCETQELKGIEVNPRFGGGYPLSYLAGADYPLWIINEYIYNKNVDWFDGWEDQLLMLRYDNEIVIHDYHSK